MGNIQFKGGDDASARAGQLGHPNWFHRCRSANREPSSPQQPLWGQLPPVPQGFGTSQAGRQGYRQRGAPRPAACARSIPVGQEVRAGGGQRGGQRGGQLPAGHAKSSGLVTSQRGLSPEPVSHLHVVVPAQPASVEVQGGEVQDDLRLGWGGRAWGELAVPRGVSVCQSAVLGRAGCQRQRQRRLAASREAARGCWDQGHPKERVGRGARREGRAGRRWVPWARCRRLVPSLRG